MAPSHRRPASAVDAFRETLRNTAPKRLPRAQYRGDPGVEPTTVDLQRPGQRLLLTSAGPLDVLGVAVGERDFERLRPCSDLHPLGGGLEARVLRLDEIIAMKEQLSHDKDLAALPMLRAALRVSKQREADSPRYP